MHPSTTAIIFLLIFPLIYAVYSGGPALVLEDEGNASAELYDAKITHSVTKKDPLLNRGEHEYVIRVEYKFWKDNTDQRYDDQMAPQPKLTKGVDGWKINIGSMTVPFIPWEEIDYDHEFFSLKDYNHEDDKSDEATKARKAKIQKTKGGTGRQNEGSERKKGPPIGAELEDHVPIEGTEWTPDPTNHPERTLKQHTAIWLWTFRKGGKEFPVEVGKPPTQPVISGRRMKARK